MPPYIEPADPLDVLSQLNELVQENNDEDICVVCQDILDNGQEQIFYLPECGHGYHTNCIMTWFRAGNDACPCCGNKGINSIHNTNSSGQRRGLYGIYYASKQMTRSSKFKLLKKTLESNQCPNDLKRIFKNHNKACEDLKELEREKRDGAAERDKMPHKEATAIINSLREKLFRKKRIINITLKQIMDFPVVPLIIPTKKRV